MSKSNIKIRCLIKFMAPKHVHSFLYDGLLYMNTLEYFRTFEEEDELLRADCYEGLTASYNSENVEMALVKNGSRLESTGKIDIYQPLANSINVYCMVMITDNDLISPFQLIKRFEKFGCKAAVIEGVNIDKFLNRLKSTVEIDLNLGSIYPSLKMAGPVGYVPRKFHHQELNAFNKFSEYSWQREFRIVLGRKVGDGVLPLKIGDISDLAYIADTSEILRTVFTLGEKL